MLCLSHPRTCLRGTPIGTFPLYAAILAAGSPEVAPFMADETVEAVCGGGKVEYTLKAYLEYADRLKSLVVDANESRGQLCSFT